MIITGSALRQRIQVQKLVYHEDRDAYAWEPDWRTWAAAEADPRANLFSSVGIGARGITFTLRKNSRLTLYHAFLWRKQFYFLTSTADADPGFVTVKAALCTPVECRKDADREPPGCRFPGILTEKYIRHAQLEPHGEVTGDFVLVTPKAVALAPGSWATVDGNYYLVRVPHELDPYKNEYEIRRKEDC